ncbi:MAG: hypothetical protein JWO38_6841 [Gemmataceae bacterium]|nr:hypothetical protein [Gemmataceae bacterium]
MDYASLFDLPLIRDVNPSWPPNSGHYRGKGQIRGHGKNDDRAFRKRVAKRRAKKGYR